MPTLTLPYPTSANRLWRNWNGLTAKSKEARAFLKETAVRALQAGVKAPFDGSLWVAIVLHPKKPLRASQRPLRSIDLDNACKLALDALNGIAWQDDRQIDQLTVTRKEPVPDGALVVSWGPMDD